MARGSPTAAVAAAPAAAPAFDAADVSSVEAVTFAHNCKCSGTGLSSATVRQAATFAIEARDGENLKRQAGGDHFFVAIRGCGVRLRARVTDNHDGTYDVKCFVGGHKERNVAPHYMRMHDVDEGATPRASASPRALRSSGRTSRSAECTSRSAGRASRSPAAAVRSEPVS